MERLRDGIAGAGVPSASAVVPSCRPFGPGRAAGCFTFPEECARVGQRWTNDCSASLEFSVRSVGPWRRWTRGAWRCRDRCMPACVLRPAVSDISWECRECPMMRRSASASCRPNSRRSEVGPVMRVVLVRAMTVDEHRCSVSAESVIAMTQVWPGPQQPARALAVPAGAGRISVIRRRDREPAGLPNASDGARERGQTVASLAPPPVFPPVPFRAP